MRDEACPWGRRVGLRARNRRRARRRGGLVSLFPFGLFESLAQAAAHFDELPLELGGRFRQARGLQMLDRLCQVSQALLLRLEALLCWPCLRLSIPMMALSLLLPALPFELLRRLRELPLQSADFPAQLFCMLAEPRGLQMLGCLGHVSNFAFLLLKAQPHLLWGGVVLLTAGPKLRALGLAAGVHVVRVRGLRVDRRVAMLGRALLGLLLLLLFGLFLFRFLLLFRLAAFGFRLGLGVAAGVRPGLVGGLPVFAALMLIRAGGEREQGCGDKGRADRGWEEWF